MSYQVSHLLENVGPPVSASADEPLGDAFNRMLHHGFSQLPVVKGGGQLSEFFFITHESVLTALHNLGSRLDNPHRMVEDALVKVPKVYLVNDDLFELLAGMRETNAALIVNDERKVTHVVTSYDTTRYFRQWAEDIMRVRDVEYLLRRIITAAFKKRDGEIDEQSRQSAIDEITSTNRSRRGKFVAALKRYLERQSASRPAMKTEHIDVAFAELIKESQNLSLTAAPVNETAQHGGTATYTVWQESNSAKLLVGSGILRSRFEAALQCYLHQQYGDVRLDEGSIEDALTLMSDRSERARTFGELALGDCIQLFFNEKCWGRCKNSVKLEQEAVKHLLEGVRDTRNDLAHFREEEVTAQKRSQLKACAEWLGDREKLICSAFVETPEL